MANGFQLRPVRTDPGALGRGVQTGLQLGGAFQAGRERRRQQPLADQQQQLPLLVEGAKRISVVQDPQSKLAILNTMRGNFERAGLSTTVLDEGIQQLQSGDLEGFQQSTDRLLELGQQLSAGGRGTGGIQQAQAVPGVGFITLSRQGQVGLQQLPEEDRAVVQEALQNEAQRKAEAAGLRTGATEEAKIEAAAEKAGEVKRGGAIEERRQSTINLGVDASKGLPVLKRSLELLDTIQTGGFAAAQLRFQQAFGIEGADEGELSANLGKAVLTQLKSTFGSAFTEREGSRLERIEAGFGKSPATNRRLLGNLLQLVEREANSAIKAAVESKDFRTAAEIQELLEFEFQQEQPAVQPVPATPTPTAAAPVQAGGQELPEGAIIRSPATGQRMQVVNGQLVEIQ